MVSDPLLKGLALLYLRTLHLYTPRFPFSQSHRFLTPPGPGDCASFNFGLSLTVVLRYFPSG